MPGLAKTDMTIFKPILTEHCAMTAQDAQEVHKALKDYVVALCGQTRKNGIMRAENGHASLAPEMRDAKQRAAIISMFTYENDPRLNPYAYEATLRGVDAYRFRDEDQVIILHSQHGGHVMLRAKELARYMP